MSGTSGATLSHKLVTLVAAKPVTLQVVRRSCTTLPSDHQGNYKLLAYLDERLSTALAMVEAAYLEARRRREM